MSKTTYKNTLTIPNSSSDAIANGSTVGGDIMVNFKALADIVHKGSSNTASGVALGTTTSNTASGTYSATVGGSSNFTNGQYSATVGGYGNYNYQEGAVLTGYYAHNNYVNYGFVSNQDVNNISIGGLAFTKGVTIGSYNTHYISVPMGGSMILKVHEMVPSLNIFASYTLYINPTSSGTIYRQLDNGSGSYCDSVSFYYNNGSLAIRNDSYYPAQFGLFGTICGQILSASGDDYYYYY